MPKKPSITILIKCSSKRNSRICKDKGINFSLGSNNTVQKLLKSIPIRLLLGCKKISLSVVQSFSIKKIRKFLLSKHVIGLGFRRESGINMKLHRPAQLDKYNKKLEYTYIIESIRKSKFNLRTTAVILTFLLLEEWEKRNEQR